MPKYAIVNSTQMPYKFSRLHQTRGEAVEEAKKLCIQENCTFFVVSLIQKVYLDHKPIIVEAI